MTNLRQRSSVRHVTLAAHSIQISSSRRPVTGIPACTHGQGVLSLLYTRRRCHCRFPQSSPTRPRLPYRRSHQWQASRPHHPRKRPVVLSGTWHQDRRLPLPDHRRGNRRSGRRRRLGVHRLTTLFDRPLTPRTQASAHSPWADALFVQCVNQRRPARIFDWCGVVRRSR